jgi:hypothetical protein
MQNKSLHKDESEMNLGLIAIFELKKDDEEI